MLVDLFIIQEGAIGAIQVFNIRGIEVSKDPGMKGADALLRDTDVIVIGPSQIDCTGAKF